MPIEKVEKDFEVYMLESQGATESDEISIIAKITNLDAWKALEYLNHGTNIDFHDGTWLVTGKICLGKFEELKGKPFVTALQVAGAVHPAQHSSAKNENE